MNFRSECWSEKGSCAGRDHFASQGFALLRSLFATAEMESLKEELGLLGGSARPGQRGLLQRSPKIAALARDRRLLDALSRIGGSIPFAVRGILFDKTPAANWGVGWHQDLAIAVKERADIPSFGPWSIKEGVVHAHAPVEVLEQMLTARIHLDDAGNRNGALRVVPGSHLNGKLNEFEMENIVAAQGAFACTAQAGDVLVMRPLILHASSPAIRPFHRRVIHLEYAVGELPQPLEWYERLS